MWKISVERNCTILLNGSLKFDQLTLIFSIQFSQEKTNGRRCFAYKFILVQKKSRFYELFQKHLRELGLKISSETIKSILKLCTNTGTFY